MSYKFRITNLGGHPVFLTEEGLVLNPMDKGYLKDPGTLLHPSETGYAEKVDKNARMMPDIKVEEGDFSKPGDSGAPLKPGTRLS